MHIRQRLKEELTMVTETVEQVKKLHAIEDVEQAIFALERGMPVHPRIIETMKMLCRVLILDYNSSYASEEEDDGGGGQSQQGNINPLADDGKDGE